MSDETRSQDAISDSPIPTARVVKEELPPAGKVIAQYDFRHPHRISKERVRTLEAMHERMARSLEGWLLSRLRAPQVEVSLEKVSQGSFGEFVSNLPPVCAAYIYDITNAGGSQAVVNVDLSLCDLFVDRFFGGFGSPVLMQRAATPIERMTVRKVTDRVTKQISEIWAEYVALEFDLNSFESVPEIIRANDPTDSVLNTRFRIQAVGVSGEIRMCLPFSVIDRFLQQAGSRRLESTIGTPEERAQIRAQAEALMLQVRLPVLARTPTFRLSLRDLDSLEVGMILDTGIPRSNPIQVAVRDQIRYTATVGRVRNQVAITIDEAKAPTSSRPTPHQNAP